MNKATKSNGIGRQSLEISVLFEIPGTKWADLGLEEIEFVWLHRSVGAHPWETEQISLRALERVTCGCATALGLISRVPPSVPATNAYSQPKGIA